MRMVIQSMHPGDARVRAFSPDGKLLATAGDDFTIKLWRTSDGMLLRTIAGHTDSIARLKWSPDGRFLASGSRDQS